MNALILPILLPILGAALCLLAKGQPRVQAIISGVTVHLGAVVAWYLLHRARSGRIDVLHFGGWENGFGIVFLLDMLAAIMLVLASTIQVVTWWFVAAGVPPPGEQRHYFHTLFLIITAGVSWAFLTADLFNLFVSFELILICSYALLARGSDREALRESYRFLIVNAVAGTFFLLAAGLIYGAYGTLNLAELSHRIATESRPGVLVFGSLLLVVFGLKAAIFPLCTWLPTAYPATPLAILPFFTGLLTKVGVYSLYRIYPLITEGEGAPTWFRAILLGVAAATMLLGVLAALSQWTMRNILSIHIISQIGYMIFGLALLSPIGLAGGILSIAHNVIVKTALFLVAAVVVTTWGHDRIKDIRGIMSQSPVLSTLFLLSAVSLAGLPPFSGFYSKWFLTLEGFRQGAYSIAAVAVITGLFTLSSMVKIWIYAFWGEAEDDRRTPRRALLAVAGGLVAVSLVFILLSAPIVATANLAATQLLDPDGYRTAILATPPELIAAADEAAP